MPPRHIAILGGGLTGLSSAFHLARRFPNASITLLERDVRLGGWVRSDRIEVDVPSVYNDVPSVHDETDVDVPGRGDSNEKKTKTNKNTRATVVIEAGPRTLRPNAKSVLELVNLLNLRSEVIITPKSSDAARSRFIYLEPTDLNGGRGKGRRGREGKGGLTRIPTSIPQLLTSPLRPLLLTAVVREFFRPGNRPPPPSLSVTSSPSPSFSDNRQTQNQTQNQSQNQSQSQSKIRIRNQDESLSAFLTRRFGSSFARILGSALVHGIYAADARKLSVRAAFPALWEAEERGGGSVGKGVVRGLWPVVARGLFPWGKNDDENERGKDTGGKDERTAMGKGAVEGKGERMGRKYDLGNVPDLMRGAAVYSFRGGMQMLTDALERAVCGSGNVEVLRGEDVRRVDVRADGELLINTRTRTIMPTHILSALPLPILHGILPQSQSQSQSSSHTTPEIPHLLANPTSTVTVVNLVFPAPPAQIHPPGFGYLVPRPEEGYPYENEGRNPCGNEVKSVQGNFPATGKDDGNRNEKRERDMGILGVVFDSCALGAQDTYPDPGGEARLTKMTVMLGGPYLGPSPAIASSAASAGVPLNGNATTPSSSSPSTPSSPSSSSPDMDIDMDIPALLKRIQTHLGSPQPLPDPVYVRVWRHEGCIPTLTPGHVGRMEEVRRALKRGDGKRGWAGRMEVVGAGVGGVSVGDCVEAGRRAGEGWAL